MKTAATHRSNISPGRDIGSRIRILREMAGITRPDLAERVGISVSAICFWETGRYGDAQKHLPVIASALGVDVEALLTGYCLEAIPEDLTRDEYVMIQLYRQLDHAEKIMSQKRLEAHLRKTDRGQGA